MDAQFTTRKPDVAGLAIAAGLLLIAAIIAIDSSRLQISSTYGMGPKVVPFVMAAGLALLGLGNAIAAWRGDLPARDDYDPRAILLILGGLLALIAVIGLDGGFIIAVTILFTATSAAFDRRAVATDIALGFALGLVAYLMFDKLLSLSLPAGPLERLI